MYLQKRIWTKSYWYKKLVGTALLVGLLVTVLPTNQTSFAATSTKPTLEIKNVSAYVLSNNVMNLEIKTDADVNASIHIDLFRKTNTRSQLTGFASKLGKGTIKDRIEIPLSSAEQTSTGYKINIPINTGEASLSISEVGVYPMSFSVITSNNKSSNTQYSFTTYLPNVSAGESAYSQKLSVAPLLIFDPLINRQTLTNNSKSAKELLESNVGKYTKVSGSLTRIASFGANTSLVISPEALENAALLATLSSNDAVSELYNPTPNEYVQYIQDSYVPMNIAELEKAGKPSLFSDFLALGRTVMGNAGYTTPSRTLVTQAMTKDSIVSIVKSGVDNLVLDDSTFAQKNRPSQRYAKVFSGDFSVSVATAEYQLANSTPESLSSDSKANYLVAATSVIALESPSISRGAIMPLDLGELNPYVAEKFISSVANNPLTKTIKIDQFFKDLDEDKALSKQLEKATLPTPAAKSINTKQINMIEKLALAGESVYPDTSINHQIFKWSRLAMLSRSDRKVGSAITVDTMNNQISEIRNSIGLPEKRTLTITSKENKIPVTIRNTSGKVLKVVVEVNSSKLSFPKGYSFEATLNQENTTITVPVKARTSGSFPISVKVLTPEQNIEIAQQGVTIRSSAFSGVGIAISIASILFLAFWWAIHYRKKSNKVAPVIDLKIEKRA